jgi:peptidoglycan/xylan/chitin deacetylase (PgdA/CDA1 family)
MRECFVSTIDIRGQTTEEELAQKYNMFCDEDDIKEADPRYVTIGSHTHTHPVMSALSYEEQYYQIEQSKAMLCQLGGDIINALAIPFGTPLEYNADTFHAAFDCGFKYVFTGEGNSVLFHKRKNIYDRKGINTQTLKDLRWILTKPDFYKKSLIGL